MGAAEDRVAIEETLAQYCRSCDDGRFDDLAALFAATAELVIGADTFASRDDIRDAIAARQTAERRGRHMTANLVVRLDGSTAHAECDFVFFAFDADGRIAPSVVGRYVDVLGRIDDEQWRFVRREIRMAAPPQPGRAPSDTTAPGGS